MKVGILTVSDRSFQGIRPDGGGPLLKRVVEENGWKIGEMKIVPDEKDQIKSVLINWTDHRRIELILTTGGTGIGPRDVTPEATQEVLEKTLPGVVELMRSKGLQQTLFAALSRAEAGIRGNTLIVNLPGNPDGAKESLTSILPLLEHAHSVLSGHDHSEHSHKAGRLHHDHT